MANSSSSCILNVTETSSPDRGCILPQNVDEFQHDKGAAQNPDLQSVSVGSDGLPLSSLIPHVPRVGPFFAIFRRFLRLLPIFLPMIVVFPNYSSFFSEIIPFFPDLKRVSPVAASFPRFFFFLLVFPAIIMKFLTFLGSLPFFPPVFAVLYGDFS